MSVVIKAPNALQLDGNVVENYIRFKRDFDNFLVASELDTKSDKIKIAILETYIGDDGLKLLETFDYEPAEEGKFAAVIGKLENHCRYRKNVVMERFKFLRTHQNDGQSFDEYFALLKLRISNCKYGDQETGILRDQLLVGLRDTSVQQRALRKADLTLDEAVRFCKSAEKSVRDASTGDCASFENPPTRRRSYDGDDQRFHRNAGLTRYLVDRSKRSESSEYNCRKCGFKHKPRECFAYGKFCSICDRPNHFAIGCSFKNRI